MAKEQIYYEEDILDGPGITIEKSKVSMAFTLITFMVGELVFVQRSIEAPIQLNNYDGIETEAFLNIQAKMLKILKHSNKIHLDIEESILLYLIVDIVCKCFVNETNLKLTELAKKNMSIDEKEYKQVRMSYLHFAETLISRVNKKFNDHPKFHKTLEKLRKWKKK